MAASNFLDDLEGEQTMMGFTSRTEEQKAKAVVDYSPKNDFSHEIIHTESEQESDPFCS